MALLRIGLLYWLLVRVILLIGRLRSTLGGEPVSVSGTSCLCAVHRSRGSIYAIELGIEMEPLFCFAIRRENAFDRFAKWLHVAQEWQTGESEFDARFYLLSDDPTLLRVLSSDSKLRSLVNQLFSHSAIRTLRCNAGKLWVEHTGAGSGWRVSNQEAASAIAEPLVPRLCEIRDHLCTTSAQAWTSDRDPGVRRERVLFAVTMALSVAGVLGFSLGVYWTTGDPPRLLALDRTEALALQVCVVVVIALVAVSFRLLRDTARLHLVLAEIVLSAAPGTWFAARGALITYDIQADTEPGRTYEVHIDRAYTTETSRSRHNYLVVKDWPDSRIDPTLEVGLSLYQRVASGDCLRLSLHRGKVGAPWTAALDPDRRCADRVEEMPLWAYGVLDPPKPGDTAKPQRTPGPWFDPAMTHDEQLKPLHIQGSTQSYTLFELNDGQHVPDWFPQTHGPVPHVIEHGPESLGAQTRACGYCHRVLGGGRPENAPVFGLPVAYFLRQLDDFRNGRRRSSDTRKPNVPTMIGLAKAISDEEARAAAEYWSEQSGGPHVKVIETENAPPAKLDGNLYVATTEERTEPLVGRILEVPEDHAKSGRVDDPRSGFIAYVPVGSIERGRKIAGAGPSSSEATAADATACVTCHGATLHGMGDAPPLAGRSPSYIVRQLYDFKTGTRGGTMSALMRPVVEHLTTSQMTDVAAYLAAQQ
jgi:cytochrome c553